MNNDYYYFALAIYLCNWIREIIMIYLDASSERLTGRVEMKDYILDALYKELAAADHNWNLEEVVELIETIETEGDEE
jgi:hypothetical protein